MFETILSHVVALAIGAAVVWLRDRPRRRQFQLMLEAIDEGKEQGADWKLVRDASGRPTGFRLTLGASAPSDKPGAV
jgi:hypothetical protein